MSHDEDYRYALELQKKLDKESTNDEFALNDSVDFVEFKAPKMSVKRSNPHSNLDSDYLNRTQNLVHPEWETLDPTPDVQSLFKAFDDKFFQGRLKCVTLEWSKRMYSCAGICYSRRNRLGMSVTVRLSEPLLKLRPRKDLVETMLHEMIHAYCFVLDIREGNGGHGPQFHKIMYAINKVAGTNITVYHTFNDEVELYKQHWWRCNGSCQNRSPFFGYVKRTCNRAPGPNDQWWAGHQDSCGGTFMKIKGPEKKVSEKPKTTKKNTPVIQNGNDMLKYLTNNNNNNNIHTISKPPNTKSPFTSTTKGPARSNGGGVLMLNPTTKSFPPSSYPGVSSDPFNAGPSNPRSGSVVNNIRGFRDLEAAVNTKPDRNSLEGPGYSLSTSSSSPAFKGNKVGSGEKTPGREVDRNHLRSVWTKRFENTNQPAKEVKPICIDINDDNDGLRRKRRKSFNIFELSDGEEDSKKQKKDDEWLVVDAEVMVRDQKHEVISLSSSDDDDDDDQDQDVIVVGGVRNSKKPILTQEQRQTVIKQEIMDESMDLTDDDDIDLIDDDYDDNAADLSAAAELADTSIIDEFFGEDTLLKEFRDENDVRPRSSRYIANPDTDIITCPICQGKMQRNRFANHLDGCTGIARRIQPSTKAFRKQIDTASDNKVKAKRKPKKGTKDLLREAGYTERDLADITHSTSDDESITDLSIVSNSPLSSADDETDTRRYRQRSIFKSTVQCPKCGTEQDDINAHLDLCLRK